MKSCAQVTQGLGDTAKCQSTHRVLTTSSDRQHCRLDKRSHIVNYLPVASLPLLLSRWARNVPDLTTMMCTVEPPLCGL